MYKQGGNAFNWYIYLALAVFDQLHLIVSIGTDSTTILSLQGLEWDATVEYDRHEHIIQIVKVKLNEPVLKDQEGVLFIYFTILC